jgi:hypothetical protein
VAVAVLGVGGVAAHAALTSSGSDASGDSAQMPVVLPDGASTGPGAVPSVSPAGTPSAMPSAVPSPTATPAVTPASPHRQVALRLVVVRGISWVEVRRPGGRVLVSGIVRHGRHLAFAHGPLDVVIGNAGAVRLTRNGHTHRAGAPGQVLRFTVR